jgi:hypothetical protein
VLGAIIEYFAFFVQSTILLTFLFAVRRYRAVVVHGPPEPLVFAAFLAKAFRRRVILDIRDRSADLFEIRAPDSRTARLPNRVLTSLERLATSFADVVTTVHEPYREALMRNRIPKEKIAIVMNTLPTNVERAVRRTIGGSSTFDITYHGTLSTVYGVDILIAAFVEVRSMLTDARLNIFGDGAARRNLVERAEASGASQSIFFSEGFLDHDHVLTLIRDTKVGVIPNHTGRINQFALPTKLFDYVALRVPVIATSLPTIRAHFDENEVLYVPPGDPHALAQALLDVARDPQAAAARAAAAHARYRHAYRWERSAGAFLEAIGGPTATGEQLVRVPTGRTRQI